MPDFSYATPIPPLHLGTYSEFSCGPEAPTAATPAAITWVANLAIYVPVFLPFPYPVKRVWWINGSTITSTSVDVGIYTPGGGKVYSMGPVAMAGASSVQYQSVSTPFVLAPGSYFFAWVCNNTTSRGWGSTALSANVLRMMGCFQQASVGTLPSAATYAQVSNALFPHWGITMTASGF